MQILTPSLVVLYAINLDLVMPSGPTQIIILGLTVGAHRCPSGWMKCVAQLTTVTCLSVITMATEIMTVHILKMLE